MFEPFIVEVWGEPAGLVLKDGEALRFHALAAPFFALENAPFNTLGHARLAAARLRPAPIPVMAPSPMPPLTPTASICTAASP